MFRENGYLAESLIRRGYFANKFDLYDYNGQLIKEGRSYIPFLSNTFAVSIDELERRKVKGGILKSIGEVKISEAR